MRLRHIGYETIRLLGILNLCLGLILLPPVFCSPTKKLFLGSTPHPFWKPRQKMDHLPLSQLLFYLKLLEYLIQTKFNQLFWGVRSGFSESIVATAQIFRSHSSEKRKSVTFCDVCVPAQALSQGQELPQFVQDLSLAQQIVTPCLADVTGELENLPSSTSNTSLFTVLGL